MTQADPRPLLDWPNAESIREAVLSRIALYQGDAGGDGYWLDQAATNKLAPAMAALIADEIDRFRLTDKLMGRIDREQDELARAILEKLEAILEG